LIHLRRAASKRLLVYFSRVNKSASTSATPPTARVNPEERLYSVLVATRLVKTLQYLPIPRTKFRSISFSSTYPELNILGLKYGSICRIKGGEGRRKGWERESRGKRFPRDLFPRCERFSQGREGRSTSAVRFSDRRSISRQIEFFQRSKNAAYKPAGRTEGNIRPLGL